jgi:enolase
MIKIQSIRATSILDSRGLPSVQVITVLVDVKGAKFYGKGSAPSGASTGSHEALELRDGDNQHYQGKSVNKAIGNVNKQISDLLVGNSFRNAVDIDQAMLILDGTENKSNLGSNAILAVSNSIHRAFAKTEGLELYEYLRKIYFSDKKSYNFPRIMSNEINGGAHADNDLSVQEFMVIPKTNNLLTDIEFISNFYHKLKLSLRNRNYSTGLGDEGGFAPQLKSTESVFDFMLAVGIDNAFSLDKFDLGIDVASSEFYNKSTESYFIDGKNITFIELNDIYKEWVSKYPLISIEDGFSEDDILGWKNHNQELGNKIIQVGDDLFVTNMNRFQSIGLDQKIANAILIKPNQIGSIKETCDVIKLAQQNKYTVIISHRSGETNDSLISDLSVACNSEFIKIGAPARGERVAKFNRLIEIYELQQNAL